MKYEMHVTAFLAGVATIETDQVVDGRKVFKLEFIGTPVTKISTYINPPVEKGGEIDLDRLASSCGIGLLQTVIVMSDAKQDVKMVSVEDLDSSKASA